MLVFPISCDAFVYALGEKMPKTEREAVPRKNIRIPTPLVDEVDGIVREWKLYINRQQFIESAIREKVEKFKLVEEREATNLRSETRIKAPLQEVDDDLLVHVKETFLAHAIIGMVKEKTLPAHHLDLKQFEERIRLHIKKRAKQEGRKITGKRLDELTRNVLQFHKEILKGLKLMSRR